MSSAPVTRIERYAGWLCAHPWMVIIATALIAFTLVSGGSRLKTTNDFRAFFGPDNPELVELELFEQTYERQQNILFVVIAEPNSVFTRDALTLIHELTEMGWQIPYSRRVTSLTNHQHTRASDDELIVRALLDDPTELSDEGIQSIRDFALGEESLLNRIISREGKATVINVALTWALDKPDANTEVVAFASERVEKLRERFPDIEIAVGGTTATDIALAWLVARAVFGKGHPAVDFLLLLAVADDAIGLVIIAVFYGDPEQPAEPVFLGSPHVHQRRVTVDTVT